MSMDVSPEGYRGSMAHLDYRLLLAEAESDLRRWDVDREFQAWIAARVANHIDHSINDLKEFFMGAVEDVAAAAARVEASESALEGVVDVLTTTETALQEEITTLQGEGVDTTNLEAIAASLNATADAADAKVAAATPPVAGVPSAPVDTTNPPVPDTPDGEAASTVPAVPDASQPDAGAPVADQQPSDPGTSDVDADGNPVVTDEPAPDQDTNTVNEGAPGATDGDVTGAT